MSAEQIKSVLNEGGNASANERAEAITNTRSLAVAFAPSLSEKSAAENIC